MLTVAFLIMKNFLFISGLLVFCLGCIAIDKNYLGLGVFLVGFSTWFFINSLLHYLAKFEKITDHERRINSLKLKSKEIIFYYLMVNLYVMVIILQLQIVFTHTITKNTIK